MSEECEIIYQTLANFKSNQCFQLSEMSEEKYNVAKKRTRSGDSMFLVGSAGTPQFLFSCLPSKNNIPHCVFLPSHSCHYFHFSLSINRPRPKHPTI